jgi:hypothetical protein
VTGAKPRGFGGGLIGRMLKAKVFWFIAKQRGDRPFRKRYKSLIYLPSLPSCPPPAPSTTSSSSHSLSSSPSCPGNPPGNGPPPLCALTPSANANTCSIIASLSSSVASPPAWKISLNLAPNALNIPVSSSPSAAGPAGAPAPAPKFMREAMRPWMKPWLPSSSLSSSCPSLPERPWAFRFRRRMTPEK